MAADLSILVPNYNRPAALARLLGSVFTSIEAADAYRDVRVLVVDDHSTEDLTSALEAHLSRPNFTFKQQRRKCGNAEVAFLSALEDVETDYVWLLGNDDQITTDAVGRVLNLLRHDVGFMLLNPTIINESPKMAFTPIGASSEVVRYERCADLFYDFGFVTSTTTFPCIVVRTAPLRDFHQTYKLTGCAHVYSHTFSIFSAFHDAPGLFFQQPVIEFSLNELEDERSKLEGQITEGVKYAHQTVGLASLIRRAVEITGADIGRLGWAREDEISKTTFATVSTFLGHFLFHFFVEQLWTEQSDRSETHFRSLSMDEINGIASLFQKFGDDRLLSLCLQSIKVAETKFLPRRFKRQLLRMIQKRSKRLAEQRDAQDRRLHESSTTRKLFLATATSTYLSGQGLDDRG